MVVACYFEGLCMKEITLEITPEIIEATRLPYGEIAKEFRKELALALYQRGALASGKARVLAQMTRWEFDVLLGEREIPRHYTEADLEDDISYGLSYQ